LCERVAEQLTPLIGDAGVAAIYTRSLHLRQRNIPGLAPVRASAQGDAPFALLQQSLEQLEPGAATDAAVDLLATVSESLTSFIGEGLTTRLLSEAWPDGEIGSGTSGFDPATPKGYPSVIKNSS
jgi:hypothetical protein